jgi:hypothetical protein
MSYFRMGTHQWGDGDNNPLINLPWGDEETRGKVRAYERQLLEFDPEAKTRDLVMAGWFPETQIRRWNRQRNTHVQHKGYTPTGYGRSVADRYPHLKVA